MMKQLPFSVIHEDGRIIAVNKAPGVTVGADRWDDSRERLDRLTAAFLAERDGGEGRIFILHRIDRDTSGLVVFAKTEEAHRELSGAFASRKIKKRYYAVVHGRPVWGERVCDLALIPNGNKRHHTIVDKYRGKKSLTRFRLLGSAGNYSLLEALPETGRTHQIRVHLAALGHSVVCDELYGSVKPVYLSAIKRGWQGDPRKEKPLLARLGLHAAELSLPGFGEAGGDLPLKAPLPRDMAALINQMGKASAGSFL
jgi:23S rRNA pseudouridine1911/1915/1917 synthase